MARIASHGFVRVRAQKAVPKVTYTDPEVAQVGLGWEAAAGLYGGDCIYRIEVPLDSNDRARTDTAGAGILVVIARRLSGRVLGAHMIGPRAGELITIFTIAIDHKLSLWRLNRVIYAYPTYALWIKKATDTFITQQLQHIRTDILSLVCRHRSKVAAALVWSIVLFTFQYYRVSNDHTYQELLVQLFSFFTGTVYGPLLYIVVYTIRPLIFFPATVLTALSGALFGFWWGIVYTIVGENLSANLAYWIGRFFGKDGRLENGVFGSWVQALRERPYSLCDCSTFRLISPTMGRVFLHCHGCRTLWPHLSVLCQDWSRL